uniref:Uncharacterized protein n=1 Tax=Picea sitchensis TaxID=3332 RepID=A9NQM2_PICSI|nr:unknown [Picea sitchensis]
MDVLPHRRATASRLDNGRQIVARHCATNARPPSNGRARILHSASRRPRRAERPWQVQARVQTPGRRRCASQPLLQKSQGPSGQG